MHPWNRKTAFIFIALLAMTALLAPGFVEVCQAASSHRMAVRSCCQGKMKCGPQLNFQCCCQDSNPSSRPATPVQTAHPELAKAFPFLCSLLPLVQSYGTSADHLTATIAFHAPPTFLAHHAFLC